MNDQKEKLLTGQYENLTISLIHPVLPPSEGNLPESTTPGTWADAVKKIGSIEWDWHGWLPKGFLTIVAGKVETGKSYLLLRIAACYCQGLDWPDGSKFMDEPSTVLWCEAEAGQAAQLERAQKMGMPMERVLLSI